MNYYDLARIKVLITQEQYRITTSAIQSAHDMGLYEEDICECIVDYLNATHFYKSMPSERFQRLWQDVYKLRYRGFRIYLKLQIGHTGRSVVISFKEDTGFGYDS